MVTVGRTTGHPGISEGTGLSEGGEQVQADLTGGQWKLECEAGSHRVEVLRKFENTESHVDIQGCPG